MMSAILLSMCVSNAQVHEGFSPKAHRDSHGTLAIGYGYNLTYNQLHLDKKTITNFKHNGISKVRATQLATQVCREAKVALETKYEWFDTLSLQRASVLLDMSYNLGFNGLTGFDKTMKYLSQGRMTLASKEMLQSKWAKQTKGRATKLSQIIKTG